MEAAPLFDDANGKASWNPKLRRLRSDAYRALLRTEGRFDVIASEPSNPWVTGVEMLYSREFLSAARDKLTAGGVYSQWIHLYETDQATIELVLRTYRAVFDHVAVWYTQGDDLILLGFRSPERIPSLAALRARFAAHDFRAGFARAGVGSFEALLAHEVLPLGALTVADLEGPVHTLRHPRLSDRAARGFFQGTRAELPRLPGPASAAVGARNALLRREGLVDGGPLPEALALTLAGEACERGRPIECAALLARGLRAQPESPGLQRLRAAMRKAQPDEPAFADEQLARLLALYGQKAAPALDLLAAEQLTDTYVRYYQYALPFDPAVVGRAWRACVSPPEACRAGAEEAARRIGSLGDDGPAE
jgi:hypothetical protein